MNFTTTQTLDRLLAEQLAERERLEETTAAITEALQYIADAPVPRSLTSAAARLMWRHRRTPLEMIADMRRVAVSPMLKVNRTIGGMSQGHLVLSRNWSYEFGAAMDLRLFTRHGAAELIWMTSSPLRLGDIEQVFPTIKTSSRSRPVGKIVSIDTDPMARRLPAQGVQPHHTSRSTGPTTWSCTMGWECGADDPATTGAKIAHILDELSISFGTLTCPKTTT